MKAFSFLLITLLFSYHNLRAQQTVKLKKGQVVSFITSKEYSGGNTDHKIHLQNTSIPVGANGLKHEISFDLLSVNPASYSPTPSIRMFSWPDRSVFEMAANNPDWPTSSQKDSTIWEELRICGLKFHPI